MIGGTRIIGGDKSAYMLGYREGLIECRESNYDPDRIRKLLFEWHKRVYEEIRGNESTRVAAHHSAIFDVYQELTGLLAMFGEEFKEQINKIIGKRVTEVLENWKVLDAKL